MIDFVNNPYVGAEMLPYEREKLYSWVKEVKPTGVLEIGTGAGGGTSYIAEAIKDVGEPCLIHTCDPIRKPSNALLRVYPFIIYYNITSERMIMQVIKNKEDIDFIFFDGPEVPNIAYSDILTLENYIKKGTYFCMHDWETDKRGYDGGLSIKAELIRPYMERSDNWEEVEVLSGVKKNVKGEFDSVGLCLYQFKGR
jgi:hypothetical protein